jgi:hypothetical protein
MKTFVTFKINNTQYIGLPNHTGILILDDQGNNYGAWKCVKVFTKNIKSKKVIENHEINKSLYGLNTPPLAIGKCFLQRADGESRLTIQ